MTAQLLSSELSSLVQESKRKNQDLRVAAEKSLNDLRAFASIPEAQLAADLQCRPGFVKPFLLACSTQNPKLVGSGVVSLQRLISCKGLPNETLNDVLDALRECSSSAFEIQLKVLQALPSLLQNYANALKGSLLFAAFELCFLLHGNRNPAVSNTAAAALQQLLVMTFDKVISDDERYLSRTIPRTAQGQNKATFVHESLSDAYQLLNDVCLLTESQEPRILLSAKLAQNFGLELLRSVLSDYSETVMRHPELIEICHSRLIPFIINGLSEKASFPTTVRIMKIIQILLSHYLSKFIAECEEILCLLTHLLDPELAPLWKRVLCLEIFRNIYFDSNFPRRLYSYYDEQQKHRNVVSDNLSTLVRLASEKPALIGLGHQSSIPSPHPNLKDDSLEQTAFQAESLISGIGVAVNISETETAGLSSRSSNVKVPCLDQLDKQEAPPLPATYIYSLVLTCITGFSEGLAKFLLPFTSPNEAKAKRQSKNENTNSASFNLEDLITSTSEHVGPQRSRSIKRRRSLINPLKLENHPLFSEIRTSSQMIESCWPAFLATCSTFLIAALDSDYYHVLIRALQRFAQVAGLLHLSTPRDAFLTALGKHSMPSNSTNLSVAVGNIKSPTSPAMADYFTYSASQPSSNRETSPSINKSTGRERQSSDYGFSNMSTRNLLCLRALLNLGIALGSVLQKSWQIILEALLQAELALSHSETTLRPGSGHSKQSSSNQTVGDEKVWLDEFAIEAAAVKTAATRMFESTSELSDEAFIHVLNGLSCLFRYDGHCLFNLPEILDDELRSPTVSQRHHRLPSNGTYDNAITHRGNLFVLGKFDEIIKHNLSRLEQGKNVKNGWNLVIGILTGLLNREELGTELRIRAANILNATILTTITPKGNFTPDVQDESRKKALKALSGEILVSYKRHQGNNRTLDDCDIEIRRMVFETLHLTLEKCGDSLNYGWDTVFAIINSNFEDSATSEYSCSSKTGYQISSTKVLRSSFTSLQLICSDFLDSVPHSCLLILLKSLYFFSSQKEDLNISLTTITFFRRISDFLLPDSGSMIFTSSILNSKSENDLMQRVQTEERSISSTAIWLCLLVRLMRIANDSRLEVRNSALHTLFRVLDSSRDLLSPSAWHMCHNIVVSGMLETTRSNYEIAKRQENSAKGSSELANWNETAITIVGGISGLLAQSANIADTGKLTDVWIQYLNFFSELLNRESLNVSTATMIGITNMLIALRNAVKIHQVIVVRSWEIWKGGNPVYHAEFSKMKSGNQEAVVAYLRCLQEIYRLLGDNLSLSHIRDTTARLRSCIVNSDAEAYTSDIDNLSSVQRHVLDCLQMIPKDIPDAMTEVVGLLADLVVMAYDEQYPKKSSTYVALSKNAMGLLQSCMTHFVDIGRYPECKLLTMALKSLKVPLMLKYKWPKEGKEPSIWKRSATVALAILEKSIPHLQISTSQPAIWHEIADIVQGVVAADCTSVKTVIVQSDEEFDIDIYSSLRRLLIPLFGCSAVPDEAQRHYARTLFSNSIIHDPHPDDLDFTEQEILSRLTSDHIGRTQDLPPSRRSRMSYCLLDELFDLLVVQDDSSERTKLARTIAPFLILRVGITLKAYGLDQPLRGRMPQPLSQKQELLYILQKLVSLKSQPETTAVTRKINVANKQGLHQLYPLVIKALAVTLGDEDVRIALQNYIETVGQDLGVKP